LGWWYEQVGFRTVRAALQSFPRNLRSLDPSGFTARFSRDLGTANTSLEMESLVGDTAAERSCRSTAPSNPEAQPDLSPLQRALAGPPGDVSRRAGTAVEESGGGPGPPSTRTAARFRQAPRADQL
jgi:hypothetical protein